MQVAVIRYFALCLTLSGLLSACNKAEAPASAAAPDSARAPQAVSQPLPERTYDPISTVTEAWGTFRTDGSNASFAGFEGEMELQHAGVMPPAAGSDLAGAEVYRIKNSTEFFTLNRGKNAFCSETPLWLAIRGKADDASAGDEIWVALMTLEDWSSYTPDVQGYCGGGMYAPKTVG